MQASLTGCFAIIMLTIVVALAAVYYHNEKSRTMAREPVIILIDGEYKAVY